MAEEKCTLGFEGCENEYGEGFGLPESEAGRYNFDLSRAWQQGYDHHIPEVRKLRAENKELKRALEMACGINVSRETVKGVARISRKIRQRPDGSQVLALNPALMPDFFQQEARQELAKEAEDD